MLQKSDVRHGALLGAVIGGIMGGLVAVGLSFVPLGNWSINHAGVLLLIGFGVFFGMWMASLVGVSVPNSRLKRFGDDIEHGGAAADGGRAVCTRRRDPRDAAGEASRSALERGRPDGTGVSVTP